MSEEEKHKKIRNGNRYVQEEEGTGVFARDIDRLFLEYTNLRMSLYNRYRTKFSRKETQRELMSYIDEEFIKLVKEYDINGPIDFPGYIKTKLTARVSRGFVQRKFRDKDREFIPSEENAIKEMLKAENNLESLEMQELLRHIFKEDSITERDQDIIKGWLEYQTNAEIIERVSEEHDTTKSSIRKRMRTLKEEVKEKIESY